MNEPQFLSLEETQLNKKFGQKGYVIQPVADYDLFQRIQQLVANASSDFLNREFSNATHFLNNSCTINSFSADFKSFRPY